jgi:hypothetical protein
VSAIEFASDFAGVRSVFQRNTSLRVTLLPTEGFPSYE